MELFSVDVVVIVGVEFGEVEFVKVVSFLYLLVFGVIMVVNEGFLDCLEVFNDDFFGEGWIIKVKFMDEVGLDKLMDFVVYMK